jgi:hypothetical protein
VSKKNITAALPTPATPSPDFKNCKFCHYQMAKSELSCPHCGRPAQDYPNVIDARAEREALETRVKDALAAHKVSDEATAVVTEVAGNAEITMRRQAVHVGLMLMAETLPTHLKLFELGLRAYRYDDMWEPWRVKAGADIHRGYESQIHFAALTPHGMSAPERYGEYDLAFRDDMISHRTTFFHENSARWWYRNVASAPQSPIPKGFRSLWEDRTKLTIAKLADRLSPKPDAGIVASLILDPDAPEGGDFVEAHICGRISLRSFKRIKVNRKDITEKYELAIRDNYDSINLDVI